MKCPKCGKQAEGISHMRNRVGGKYVVTHDIYEHASRVEGGFRIVSSRDCCYVRRTSRALDLPSATVNGKPSQTVSILNGVDLSGTASQ